MSVKCTLGVSTCKCKEGGRGIGSIGELERESEH